MRWIVKGSLLKAEHFSMVCEGKGRNHNQICRAELLKVEKAKAACREFREELVIVSERVREQQLKFSADKWKWMHTGKKNPDSKWTIMGSEKSPLGSEGWSSEGHCWGNVSTGLCRSQKNWEIEWRRQAGNEKEPSW